METLSHTISPLMDFLGTYGNIGHYAVISTVVAGFWLPSVLASCNSVMEMGRFIFQHPVHLLVYANSLLCAMLCLGIGLKKLVFGTFRATEYKRLMQRMKFFMFGKMVILATVVAPDLPDWVILSTWFAVIGMMRMFSLVTRDRFDYVTAIPSGGGRIHVTLLTLVCSIFAATCVFTWLCLEVFWDADATVVFVLMFEPALVLVDCSHTIAKYSCHIHYVVRGGATEARRAVLLHAKYISDLAHHIIGSLHYLHLWMLHGVTMNFFDVVIFVHVRGEVHHLLRAVDAYRTYFRRGGQVEALFPDAKPEELTEANNVCCICHEVMERAKALPCHHYFHTDCLQSWLLYSSTCPFCRSTALMGTDSHQQKISAMHGPPPEDTEPDALPHMTNESMSFHSLIERFRPSSNQPRDQTIVQEQAHQLQEMFPHLALDAIERDLRRTGCLSTTTDNALAGRIALKPSDVTVPNSDTAECRNLE